MLIIRHILISIACFLLLCDSGQAAIYPSQQSDYLDSVDYYLEKASYYTDIAFADINANLESTSRLPENQQLEKLAIIGRRLEQIDIDSALTIYIRGEQLAHKNNNNRYINKFRYRRASVLPMMGLVREGIETYLSVTPEMVDKLDKFDYFGTGQHIFDAATDFYRVDSLKKKYERMSNLYNDSILIYVPSGSADELYFRALPKIKSRDRESAISELNAVLNRVAITDPYFAKAAAVIASIYQSANDWQKARYYLALSAIGDLRAGTREATSLHRLGKILNNEEDYSRAYDYLTHALEAAVASGSTLRTIEIGEIMPDVVKAARQLEEQRSRTLMLVVILLSALVLVFITLLIYAFRTRNRLNRIQKELRDINNSKDLYIRELLSLCGANLAALENFNKLVGRKIKVNQISDLLSMIESGKVIREQQQSFYEVFDDAFLAVYPNFVDKVNDLLEPDKQLSLTEDGRLGPELRIVAFMRLGLDDSAQIAKFLGLSLNTIYTYRNKVKGRAKDRSTFEQNIREIDR